MLLKPKVKPMKFPKKKAKVCYINWFIPSL